MKPSDYQHFGELPLWRRIGAQWGGLIFWGIFIGGGLLVRWSTEREMRALMDTEPLPEWDVEEKRKRST